jgi:hypothetical protein
LVAAGVVLESIALAAARRSEPDDSTAERRPWLGATLVTAAFSAVYLARIALQGGLDLTNIDYGVGGFGAAEVSAVQAVGAMMWKYVAAFGLLLLVFTGPLRPDARRVVLAGFTLVYAVRAGAVAWMLLTAGTSYWTGLRTMSELPSALIAACVGAVLTARAYLVQSPGSLAAARS